MELNWIQREVLLRLIRAEQASLKQLRPEGIEANLFTYHLQGLVQGGLIEKIARGTYCLTIEGEKFVGAFSTLTNRLTENIKTVVMLWVEHDGQTLFFRWSRQPYIHQVTLPYDRMPIGKTIQEGLESAFVDKLGIEPTASQYVASALITIKKEGKIISHMNALVYKVDGDTVHDKFTARNGQTIYGTETTESVMDGVADFLDKLRSGERLIESTWSYTHS